MNDVTKEESYVKQHTPQDDEKHPLTESVIEDHPAVEQQTDYAHVIDVYTTKRTLIINELKEIDRLMSKYLARSTKLSRLSTITKTTITGSNALAAIGLYVNVDKLGKESSAAVYYVACAGATLAAVVGALSSTWNFAERAHTNHTTYKSLHALHDFCSYQIARNELNSSQMDGILNDMSSRLILIRDSAEEGV